MPQTALMLWDALPVKWCTTVGPVLHPGRCCGTPLCGEPAVRGRGRRDAVATEASTEHWRFHHAHASVHLLQYGIYRMDDSGKSSVHRHPRLKGGYTSVRPFCANRFASNLQPTLPLSHCAKCAEETVPEKEGVGYFTLSRGLFIWFKPEHEQPAMSLSSSLVPTQLVLCSQTICVSVDQDPFDCEPMIDSDRWWLSGFLSPFCDSFLSRFLLQPGSPAGYEGAWQKAPPQDQTVRISNDHNPLQHPSDTPSPDLL